MFARGQKYLTWEHEWELLAPQQRQEILSSAGHPACVQGFQRKKEFKGRSLPWKNKYALDVPSGEFLQGEGLGETLPGVQMGSTVVWPLVTETWFLFISIFTVLTTPFIVLTMDCQSQLKMWREQCTFWREVMIAIPQSNLMNTLINDPLLWFSLNSHQNLYKPTA